MHHIETTQDSAPTAAKRIVISGGFDPLHPGHIEMIEKAGAYGQVHIVLNSDAWLLRKKGFFFQSFLDRKKILEAYTPYIHEVDDTDGTVCEALQRLRPDYFGNGGDRTNKNTPELTLCQKFGIEPVFGLGTSKYNSSSQINARSNVAMPWGWSNTLFDCSSYTVEILHIEPGHTAETDGSQGSTDTIFFPDGSSRLHKPYTAYHLTAPKDLVLIFLRIRAQTPLST